MWTGGEETAPFAKRKGARTSEARPRGMPGAEGRPGFPRSRGKCPKDKGGIPLSRSAGEGQGEGDRGGGEGPEGRTQRNIHIQQSPILPILQKSFAS